MKEEILEKLQELKSKRHGRGEFRESAAIGGCISMIKKEFPEPKKTEVIFMNVEPGKDFRSMSTGAKCRKTKNYKIGGHEFNAIDDDGDLCWFPNHDTVTVYR